MAKRPAFTLPEGLKLDITADRLSIEYDGDVEIEQDLGRRLGVVRAKGDLSVKLPVVTGDLFAGGILKVQGEIDGGALHGREIVLGRQAVKCKSISAIERITIGPATVSCDVIIAPEILIDPKASGRVTVIESQNERGATKIKGGFTLADYEDMFGNSREFLGQRGLTPLGAAPKGSAPSADMTPLPIGRDEEDVDDPLSLSLDDLEPLVEGKTSSKPSNDDLHQRLSEALGRITSCYDGSELPPAVTELRTLVEKRDYDGLRQNITEVWNGLLGFHQKRGIRPHHSVTHAFNVIHGLVQS